MIQGSPTRNTVLPIRELCFFWVQYSSRITNKKHCTPNHGVMVLLSAIWFKDHQQETLYSQSGNCVSFECNTVQGSQQKETLYSQSWIYGPLSAIGFKDHHLETLYSQSWNLGPFECNTVQGSPFRNTVLPIMKLWSFWVQYSSWITNKKHCTPNHEGWVLLSAIQFKDHHLETLYSLSWSYGPFECNIVQGSTNRNTVLPILESGSFWMQKGSRINI